MRVWDVSCFGRETESAWGLALPVPSCLRRVELWGPQTFPAAWGQDRDPWRQGRGLPRGDPLPVSPPVPRPCSLKGKSARLRHAAGAELWRRFQRPLRDLQLWRALAQRLLDVTTSLPDLPSVHTFLPQMEVTGVLPGGLADAAGVGAPLSQGKACPGSSGRLGRAQRPVSGPGVPRAQETPTPIRCKGHPQRWGRRQRLEPGVTPGLCTEPPTPVPTRTPRQALLGWTRVRPLPSQLGCA